MILQVMNIFETIGNPIPQIYPSLKCQMLQELFQHNYKLKNNMHSQEHIYYPFCSLAILIISLEWLWWILNVLKLNCK